MGMPRRADIADRGRRWIPGGGKFGTITLTSVDTQTILNVSFSDASVATWSITDATGNKTEKVGNYIIHNWDTANGGMATCKLPGVMDGMEFIAQGLTSLKLKGAKKWSDLLVLNVYSNDLTELTTSDWPNLTLIRFDRNPLASVNTYAWPLLDDIQFYNCPNLTELETHAWPVITNIRGSDCTNLSTFNCAHDWPELVTINMKNCDSLTEINGGAWPKVESIYFSYMPLATFNTQNTWTSLNLLDLQINSDALTEIVTHPEWTSINVMAFTGAALSTFTTHNTWVNLEKLFMGSIHELEDLVIHPEWTKFWYLDARQMGVGTANVIDEWLIQCDTIGTSNGTIDYRLAAHKNDSERSASANTALANLVGKGWSILR